jgi:hypothetical protein
MRVTREQFAKGGGIALEEGGDLAERCDSAINRLARDLDAQGR